MATLRGVISPPLPFQSFQKTKNVGIPIQGEQFRFCFKTFRSSILLSKKFIKLPVYRVLQTKDAHIQGKLRIKQPKKIQNLSSRLSVFEKNHLKSSWSFLTEHFYCIFETCPDGVN